MNWGKGLTIAMITFMGFIATLVIIMISHNVELDNPEYYKRDLAFDGEMDALSQANGMDKHIQIEQTDSEFLVKVPKDQFITDVSILFSRPNDESQDFVIEMGEKRLEKIPMDKFNPGIYKIEFRFFSKGKSCLQKERIYI